MDRQYCPQFANAGCFVANFTNIILPNNPTSSASSGVYRGCSPFDNSDILTDVRCADIQNEDGSDWGRACKQDCNTGYCNRNEIKPPTQCHQCRIDFDHTGTQIGNLANDPDCFEPQDDKFLVTCELGADHCSTQLLTDWLPDGRQELGSTDQSLRP